MDPERYLRAASDIGDQLLDKAIKTEKGFYWETMSLGDDGQIEWRVSESLYSGVAGVVYFLLELHKRTRSPKYLHAVHEGIKWLEAYCRDNPTSYYAFYTGRMGVAYLMLELSKYLSDDSYLSKAVEVALPCDKFLKQEHMVDDLINGTSGTLLALLHLHAATGDHLLMAHINTYTNHLIQKAYLGPKGLYWDRSSKNISGLCGFSHGASGVGYVFLELGHYFDNEAFYWIADQAFAYENYHFKESINNWPDLRKGIYDEKTLTTHKREYQRGNKGFFSQPGDMTAWCHGAPGVGFSRIRAYELTGNGRYLEDLKKAVKKTSQMIGRGDDNAMPYVLCHGGGGNAILFLEAAKFLSRDEMTSLAAGVAEDAMAFINNNDEYISGYTKNAGDISLFMGSAGIGYFYLLMADGVLESPSILKPDVPSSFEGRIEDAPPIDLHSISVQLTKKMFPDTYQSLEPITSFRHYQLQGDNLITAMIDRIDDQVKKVNQPQVKELFEYEKSKIQLDSQIKSDSYLYVQRLVESEKNANLIQNLSDLKTKTLSLAASHQLAERPPVKNGESENYRLLIPGSQGIVEFPLSYFSYNVLQAFCSPRVVSEALDMLLNDFEVDTQAEKEQVRDATLIQIIEGMKQGILHVVEEFEAVKE